MKRSVLILAGAALLALASCSKEQTLVEAGRRAVVSNTGETINFLASFRALTRAAETTTANLSSFYVTSFGETSFSDLEFTKDAGSNFFISEQSYYWPETGSLAFFAYAPGVAETGGTWQIRQSAKTLRNFSPKLNMSEQVDLILASATGNKTDNEQTGVNLNFVHALSQISVQAKNTNPDLTIKVAGVRIGSVGGQASQLNAQNVNSLVWQLNTNDPVKYESTYTTRSVSLNTSAKSVMGNNGSAMLIPQALTAWDSENDKTNTGMGAYLALYVNIVKDGEVVCPQSGGANNYAWVAVPINTSWESGKKYVYTLDLNTGGKYAPDDADNPGEPVIVESEAIKFTVTVTDWNEVTEDLSM